MGRVLCLVSFRVREARRDAFLEAARTTLKPWWEAHGVERYEVFQDVGPTGPTGRVTQAFTFADRDAYLRMQRLDDPGVPAEPYRWLTDPEFRVLELLVP